MRAFVGMPDGSSYIVEEADTVMRRIKEKLQNSGYCPPGYDISIPRTVFDSTLAW